MTHKFRITDIEADKDQIVAANGLIEAMEKYLPWSTIRLDCKMSGPYMTCTDKDTDFKYQVEKVRSEVK